MSKRINIKKILGYVLPPLILVAVIILLRLFVFDITQVSGESMNPSYYDGDILIVSKMAYAFGDPEVGDVIIAKEPSKGELVVKRIAGCPGDTITGPLGKEYVLQDEEYYIRGDNTEHSRDSDDYGPILKDSILGKVILHFD